MIFAMTLFGEAWEMKEPTAASVADCANDDDDHDDWHGCLGAWQPIATAPKTGRVDLWVDVFEFYGEVVEGCAWDANAAIPDWYRTDQAGKLVLAVPIHTHASYWKPAGAEAGPVDDGGPGLLVRTNVSPYSEYWPDAIRKRFDLYSHHEPGLS